jgi:glutamate synthase (NADPH) small chain
MNQAEYLKQLLAQEKLKPKERMAIPRQRPLEANALERSSDMQEVSHSLSAVQAQIEALRCLQCKRPLCVEGCPVKIDIPAFIQAIADGDFRKGISVIKQTSLLPAVCGRVCPQEKQCQGKCTVGTGLKDVDLSVGIGSLERFLADWERESGEIIVPEVKPATGKKVAIVGSGPAGLVAAADVRREGHEVTIFEAFHKLGGVMRYGIPEFRLPNDIVDQEINTLRQMGVTFQTNFVVGRTRTVKDLMHKDGFDAVFIGSGAGLPLFTGIDGEDLVGVFAANEYLTRANLMRGYEKGESSTPVYPAKSVVVLGGGNVAMDAARMAKRLGAEHVYVLYRRSEAEMPARLEEIHHAKEEGVEFCFLQNAVKIIGDEAQRVCAVQVLRYELGEPDESGRRRPVEIPGSEFMLDAQAVLVAIGNGSNPLIAQTTPEIQVNKWGNIIVDDHGRTSLKGVYAGGDIVLGAATVILAMGEGRKAAAAINEDLQ